MVSFVLQRSDPVTCASRESQFGISTLSFCRANLPLAGSLVSGVSG
jgi:hypothetical protein